MKNMKKYIILKIFGFLLVVFIISSCTYRDFKHEFFAGYFVKDYNFEWEGKQSRKLNTNDRYCLYYNGRNEKDFKIKGYDMEKANQQLIDILKNKGLKIKEEVFNFTNSKAEKDDIENSIKKREIDNNFENCDYLLTYEIGTLERFKESYIDIRIYNIATDDMVSSYTVYGKKSTLISYVLIKQQEFINNAIDELFKYQNTEQDKMKFKSFECTSSGCRTIKCIGDKCEIINN